MDAGKPFVMINQSKQSNSNQPEADRKSQFEDLFAIQILIVLINQSK